MLIQKYRVYTNIRDSYTEFSLEKQIEAEQFAESIGSSVELITEIVNYSE